MKPKQRRITDKEANEFLDANPTIENGSAMERAKFILRLRAQLAALQCFKDYVHKRLDDAGVTKDPESPHKAEGCRIGGRLDEVFASLAAARAEVERMREALTRIENMQSNIPLADVVAMRSLAAAALAVPAAEKQGDKQPREPWTGEKWRKAIRDAGGDVWDDIEDPDAYIREMRGDAPQPATDAASPPAAEAELERMRAEIAWTRVGDKTPEPGEYEIAKPWNRNGETLFDRDLAGYGRDIDDEPFDGWHNADWHRDVPLAESLNWYYRKLLPLPLASLPADPREPKDQR